MYLGPCVCRTFKWQYVLSKLGYIHLSLNVFGTRKMRAWKTVNHKATKAPDTYRISGLHSNTLST